MAGRVAAFPPQAFCSGCTGVSQRHAYSGIKSGVSNLLLFGSAAAKQVAAVLVCALQARTGLAIRIDMHAGPLWGWFPHF
jgi:hypothetical protein